MKNLIGIVGLGYVGGAIKNSYDRQNRPVETFDINKAVNPTCDSLEELVNKTNIIYVSVPTPMATDGSCDVSIVKQIVHDINQLASNKIIVIKSTIVPGTTEQLQNEYPSNILLFNPEFLTEANYKNDYLNQDVMLVGYVHGAHREAAERVLTEQLQMVDVVNHAQVTDSTTAEFYKYVANTFLATKVSFANEMASVATKLNIQWNTIKDLISYDKRMGTSHWKVPGPDGKFGWGGTCFPKDLSAMVQHSAKLGIDVPVLNAVWHRNTSIDRPEKDWERKNF